MPCLCLCLCGRRAEAESHYLAVLDRAAGATVGPTTVSARRSWAPRICWPKDSAPCMGVLRWRGGELRAAERLRRRSLRGCEAHLGAAGLRALVAIATLADIFADGGNVARPGRRAVACTSLWEGGESGSGQRMRARSCRSTTVEKQSKPGDGQHVLLPDGDVKLFNYARTCMVLILSYKERQTGNASV